MTKPLPTTFQFSQQSLQAYVECARRFQLRHVLMQPWPALVTASPSEAEQHVQRGADFHHLAHQHTLGIDPAQLAAFLADPVLARWWRAFLEHPPAGLPSGLRRAEIGLSAPVMGYRLSARLDLLTAEPRERAVIVDWKTPLKRPSRTVLEKRLQTCVYRYLTVRACHTLNGGQDWKPEQVEMIYWFAEFGGTTERFCYDANQYAGDSARLTQLVSEILGRDEAIWPLTPDRQQCRYCNYRSLCERGFQAGPLNELEDDLEPSAPELELEQVAEIPF